MVLIDSLLAFTWNQLVIGIASAFLEQLAGVRHLSCALSTLQLISIASLGSLSHLPLGVGSIVSHLHLVITAQILHLALPTCVLSVLLLFVLGLLLARFSSALHRFLLLIVLPSYLRQLGGVAIAHLVLRRLA